ncbi:Tudor and KH domain-containing protein homolog [Gryllus bimaculatus]|nr:Tudor and KH domain-containing protein homolog [Gryllus bimaculatus]
MSNVTQARLMELKNRLELLKREGESVLSNVRDVVRRGSSVVAFQETIHEIEHFLRCYPDAVTEIDHLINNLVKLNCELEITLARRSDFCNVLSSFENNYSVFYDGDVLEKQALCEVCSKEKKTVCTNTDNVTDYNISEHNIESIKKLYDIDEDSILEMKYLHGDDPSQFWLGYYSNTELLSHLAEINRKLQLNELHRKESIPVVGQFIIGYVDRVFRGCVISVTSQIVVTVDIDTATLKLVNVHKIWEMEDYLLRFPPQAILCKLWGVEGVVDWTNHLSTFFKNCLSKCNLVITVKSIIPDVIPTFLVDVDAHDSTSLDVNLTEWINSFVTPAVEKIKLFGLSGTTEETVFQDLDPYVIYKGEDSSDIDSSTSDQQVADFQSMKVNSEIEVKVINNNQSRRESDIDSNSVREDLDDRRTEDSNGVIFNRTSVNSEMAPRNSENDDNFPTEKFLKNQVDDSDNNVKDAFHEEEDILKCEVLKSCEQPVKSAVIKCFLEKGKTLGMSFLRGKDPSDFFLSYVSMHEIDILKKKMADWAERGLLIQFPDVPEENDFAIAKYNEEYYRVRIGRVSEQNTGDILVTDVDTGDLILVSVTDLWILEEMFSLPPARAIRCSLWNISKKPLFWCVNLENLFRNVMLRGPCCVNVKDFEYTLGDWNHVVQIQIYSDCVIDVSEWILNYVYPKLKDIKQCYITGSSIDEAVSMLDPKVVHSKEKSYNNSTAQESTINQISVEVAKRSSLILEQKTEFLKCSLPREQNILPNSLKLNDELNFKTRSHMIEPKKKYYVFMASVVSPSEFYVHIISKENSFIDNMHEELSHYCSVSNIYFKSKKEARQLISECCAVNFEDRWLRARIIDWFDDFSDEVSVFFVDYGINATVLFCLIQPLRSDFYEYPVFAEKCALAFISPPVDNNSWPEKSLTVFSNLLDFNTVYEICVVNHLDSKSFCVFLFDIQNESTWCINDYLVEQGCAISELGSPKEKETENSHTVYYPIIDSGIDETISDSESIDSCCNQENVEIMPYFDHNTGGLLEVGEQLPVVMTEIVNISLFYAVHSKIHYEGKLQSTNEVLMKMSKEITSAVQSGQLKLSKRLCEGAIAVVRYNKDKQWYRARLLASPADNGNVDVFFVDYGNVDSVHKFYIREIRKDFCELPFQAMRFFLDTIDLTRLKNKNSRDIAQTLLTRLLDKHEVELHVMRIVNEDIHVKILFEGRDIGAEMIQQYHTQCQ